MVGVMKRLNAISGEKKFCPHLQFQTHRLLQNFTLTNNTTLPDSLMKTVIDVIFHAAILLIVL
jgi:hypothetical protein